MTDKFTKDTEVYVNGEKINVKESKISIESEPEPIEFSEATKPLIEEWQKFKTEDLNIEGDVFIEWAYRVAERIQDSKRFHKRNIFKQISESNLSDKQKRVLDKLTQQAFDVGWQEGKD